MNDNKQKVYQVRTKVATRTHSKKRGEFRKAIRVRTKYSNLTIMRKLTTFFGAILFASAFLSSCKTVQVAKFASVENVMELKINSSLEEVINTLGSKPYNIYSNQKEGYAIYTYKYKLVERKVSPELINSRGGETTGTEVYSGKEQILFLLFKDGKLESLVTTDGRKGSEPLIMFNNTLYTISVNKGEYTLVPAAIEDNTAEEESNSGTTSSTSGKKKKK